MDTTPTGNDTLPDEAPPPSDASHITQSPLPFNATQLFRALQYQLLVAVDHCYALTPDQCLWLEVFGDVTVSATTQVEVKFYSDNLTDSHSNFWNTLKNWLHENFDHRAYKNLVLLTTQNFGPQSVLKGWNDRSAVEKLQVMEGIYSNSLGKLPADGGSSSKPQNLQQYVMAPERRADLMEILERMKITTGAASLEDRIETFKTVHLKPIRPSKYQVFLDDLLGFLSSTKVVEEGWRITHKVFTDKVTELNKMYMKHPTTFPPIDVEALKRTIDIEEVRPRVFAQKILEIGGEHRLMKAALHRLIAVKAISELYDDGVIFKNDVDTYLRNHLEMHLDGRELAMMECEGIDCQKELEKRSMMFFLDRHKLPIDKFCNMDGTRADFRNGIYHILAEDKPKDEDDEFYWRLWN